MSPASTAPIISGADGHDGSSKATEYESTPVTSGGFQPSKPMAVQPPRKEDLQESYARVVDAETNPKGWYGNMSTSSLSHPFSSSTLPVTLFPHPPTGDDLWLTRLPS